VATYLDWMPWNHTMGGNALFNPVLTEGGTLYIDDGRPMPGMIEETLRNLREISPTYYANVPAGYAALAAAMEKDDALCRSFFKNLGLMAYGGARLPDDLYDRMQALAVRATGMRIVFYTGWGSTETAPTSTGTYWDTERVGLIGLPFPGVELKMVPCGSKYELRLRGVNVTPGYFGRPDLTRAAFDEEGFYKFGDALKPADVNNLEAGFDFDGRIAEDFKLASGTWVSVGPLRARFIAACAPLVRDVVIAGINRDEISALVIPDLDGCRLVNPALPPDDIAAAANDTLVLTAFRERFQKLLASATGSSTRIARAILIDKPLSIDRGEVTDKGSINQRAVLDHRSHLIDELYSPTPAAHVITLS
jgi:feruloyl-CoA synthase